MPGPGNLPPPPPQQPRGDWPPKIGGKEIWKSAVVNSWFWRCPTCSNWYKRADPRELEEAANKHHKNPHFPKEQE